MPTHVLDALHVVPLPTLLKLRHIEGWTEMIRPAYLEATHWLETATKKKKRHQHRPAPVYVPQCEISPFFPFISNALSHMRFANCHVRPSHLHLVNDCVRVGMRAYER